MLFSLMVYHKSTVGQALMYMQHRPMEFGESHLCHDLFLDQKVNYNAYSTRFCHEALDVDHKMVILVIGSYHKKYLHICVKHQHYPEHNILFLFILF